MPYIPKEQRDRLEANIGWLVEDISLAKNHQEALYSTIYQIVYGFLPELRYRTIARMTGALENAKQEFCRRFGLPLDCAPVSVPSLIEVDVAKIEVITGDISDLHQECGDWEGILNYTLTCIVLKSLPSREQPYLDEVKNTFEAVKQTFYRELAGPYEDEAIIKNGDVY